MGLLNVVFAVLLLLGGLKFVASPLFSSVLATRVDGLDYRVLPSLGALIFITIVVVAKIRSDAEKRTRQSDHDGQNSQRTRTNDRSDWR